MESRQHPTVIYALINLAPHEEAIVKDVLESFNIQAGGQFHFIHAPENEARNSDIIVAAMTSNNMQATHNLFKRVYNTKATVFVVRDSGALQANDYKNYVRSEDLEVKFTQVMTGVVAEKINLSQAAVQSSTTGSFPEAEDTFIGTYVGKPPKGSNGKVLIVDDSQSLRMKLQEFLNKRNFDCHQADSAEAAMKMVEKEPYDLVFMDVILPGADGYQACKAVKSLEHMKKVPVIILTSMDSPADKIRGVMSGCDKYLIKPVRGSELDVLLQSYFPGYVPPPRKSRTTQP